MLWNHYHHCWRLDINWFLLFANHLLASSSCFLPLIWRQSSCAHTLNQSNQTRTLFPGIHTCFVCKKRSEDVRRCMIPVCGKFYHGECIANFAPTVPVNRGFRCSIHVCLTCFIANPNSSTISKGIAERSETTFVTCAPPERQLCFFCLMSVRRPSGAMRSLSCSLSRNRPLHGGGLRHPLQQQYYMSQPLHSPSGCQEPWTCKRQLVLCLYRR